MKKRKIKLLASITSLILVVAVMSVGVWAASTAKATISANASFTATGMKGTLKLLKTGTDSNVLAIVGTGTPAAISADLTIIDAELSAATIPDKTVKISFNLKDKDSNSNGILTSAESATTVLYAINNTSGTPLYYKATWTDGTGTNKFTIDVQEKITSEGAYTDVDSAAQKTVAAGETTTIKVVYSITSHNGETLAAVACPELVINLYTSGSGT